jgi:hypothetical protein
MARYLNLGLQTTQTRLKAAKDSILTLVAKCEQYRGDIVATTSKPTKLNPRTVTGWKGGWLGPMKAEALISPHLVQFPDVEGQPPVRAQPLNIKTLKAKLRGVKPIFPHIGGSSTVISFSPALWSRAAGRVTRTRPRTFGHGGVPSRLQSTPTRPIPSRMAALMMASLPRARQLIF